MTNVINFIGEYQYTGTHLTDSEGNKFAIRTREPSPNKPAKFLFQFNGMGYISSLYPLSDCKYSFDYAKQNYLLEIKENKAVISKYHTIIS